MVIPPMVEMLLSNKEPSVTKNQDFSRHLPLKEGRTNNNLVALCEAYNRLASKFAIINLQL